MFGSPPAPQDFVGGGPEYKGGLNVTMHAIGEIIDLEVVPWGNARMQGKLWQCQHGPSECAGNVIESCMMMAHPKQQDWWPFVNKYEQQAHTCSRTAVPPGAAWTLLARLPAALQSTRARHFTAEPRPGPQPQP